MLLLVSLLVFASTAFLIFAASSTFARRERVKRRFGGVLALSGGADLEDGPQARRVLDPARLGLDLGAQRTLRGELIRAGFFAPAGVAVFAIARLALLVGLPTAGLILSAAAPPPFGLTERLALAAVLLIVAYVLPRAYLSRRTRELQAAYRVRFPDFLDMLVVCINAGLSLDAALDRSARELGREDFAFRANLDLMAGEMRAGKSTADALRALADRLGLPEALSFAALLRQTIELGTDVAQALTTFADEMRGRRMAFAEEKAAALPPKLTLPLGLFIFPVVLIVVLAPAVIRILTAVGP